MIEFIDPTTGEVYNVKPMKATVEAAYKLGFFPLSERDQDAADSIEYEEEAT